MVWQHFWDGSLTCLLAVQQCLDKCLWNSASDLSPPMDHFKMDFYYKIKYVLRVWKAVPATYIVCLLSAFINISPASSSLQQKLSSPPSPSPTSWICQLSYTNHFHTWVFAWPASHQSSSPSFPHSHSNYSCWQNLCHIFSEMLSSGCPGIIS